MFDVGVGGDSAVLFCLINITELHSNCAEAELKLFIPAESDADPEMNKHIGNMFDVGVGGDSAVLFCLINISEPHSDYVEDKLKKSIGANFCSCSLILLQIAKPLSRPDPDMKIAPRYLYTMSGSCQTQRG